MNTKIILVAWTLTILLAILFGWLMRNSNFMLGIFTPSARAVTLNQANVTVGLGQSVVVTAQGSTGVYLLSNSNSTVASVVTSGTQVTVTGTQLGSTTVSLCLVGSATDCANLYVTAQSAAVVVASSTLSFSPTAPALSTGQTISVAVSGGSGYYVSANSNSSIVSASISSSNSSTLNISGLANGTTAITVCSASGGCGSVTATVSSAASSQVPAYSVNNPTVSVGQSITVALSGGSTYYILSNLNSNAVQATISGSTLTLNGISAGSALLTICIAGSSCSNLSVSVTTAATQVPTVATPIPVPTPVPVQTQSSSAVDVAALLAAIQSTQSQLAQILAQIQTMANTLTQLAAKISVSVQTNAPSASAGTGASASFSGTFTQYLALGSENVEVTALQNKLATLGFYSGPVTGYLGPLTETAVKAYQSARGISSVGFVGPSTRAALNAE